MATAVRKPLISRYGGTCPRCKESFVAGVSAITQENGRWVHAGGCEAKQGFVGVEHKGVYVMPDGTVCRIRQTRDGERTYASRWHEIGGKRLTDAGEVVNAEYEYVPGLAPYVAREGKKMTLQQAAAFMVRYGVCARCGAHLKDAKSVLRGIGPVCVTFFGGGS